MKEREEHPFVISDSLRQEIDAILDKHDRDATQIVGILLDVQDIIELNYVPKIVSFYIAEKLPISISIIYDCLTFYDALSAKPRAKYPIEVCESIVCKVNASNSLFQTLKSELGIDLGEVTYDKRFCLEAVPCFGACDSAPALRINGEVYGGLDSREKVQKLLAQFI